MIGFELPHLRGQRPHFIFLREPKESWGRRVYGAGPGGFPSGAPWEKQEGAAIGRAAAGDLMSLQERVVVVTGASSGIGRAVALRFANEGARIALIARSAEKLKELERVIGPGEGEARAFPLDVGDADAVVACRDALAAEWGAPSILVHAAGGSLFGPAEEIDPTAFSSHLRPTLVGALNLLRAFLPAMKEAGEGDILLLCQRSEATARAGSACIAASQEGLGGLGRALARELAPSNVRVTLLRPAPTDTPVFSHGGKPVPRHHMLKSPVVASLALLAVTQPRGHSMGELGIELLQ